MCLSVEVLRLKKPIVAEAAGWLRRLLRDADYGVAQGGRQRQRQADSTLAYDTREVRGDGRLAKEEAIQRAGLSVLEWSCCCCFFDSILDLEAIEPSQHRVILEEARDRDGEEGCCCCCCHPVQCSHCTALHCTVQLLTPSYNYDHPAQRSAAAAEHRHLQLAHLAHRSECHLVDPLLCHLHLHPAK